MKKGKRKGSRTKRKPDADLDEDLHDYKLSESDDELGTEGKILLERAKQGRFIRDETEEEVLRVKSSSDEDDGDGGGGGYYGGGVGSDFEDEEGDAASALPSAKAWGSVKTRYYNTDYVDKDYPGLEEKEEEAARMEEEEAGAIQRRLLAELEESDFTLGLLDKVEKKKARVVRKTEIEDETEKIQTDLSELSREEKVQFLKQNSSEFFPLIEDFKRRMEFARDKIVPLLDLVESGKVPKCKASEAVHTYYCLILNYCSNITFYLVVKSKRGKAEGEAVSERLVGWRKLLLETDRLYDEVLREQVDALLLASSSSLLPAAAAADLLTDTSRIPPNRAERRKKMLRMTEEQKKTEVEVKEKKRRLEAGEEGATLGQPEEVLEEIASGEEEEEEEEKEEEVGKRGISYKMAKNKGLTAKKRKELRNPRVKHRNKFRKAKIRRKGQVREVRKEMEKYGGELSGVKAYVSKSIKLK